ncbi:MAG: histidine kinase [Schwartzia sp.]|nr:histidine kinase [Schwartzia sp. (in: firmicutes)]
MINWLEMISFTLGGIMLALTALGIGIAAIMPGTERWNRRFFMILFATIMLLIVSAFVDAVVWDNPGMAMIEKTATYFEYLLIALPMPMFTAYLLRTCGERWQGSGLFRAAIVLWVIYFLLLGVTQCTTFMYYITPDNQFFRGPYHSLLMLPPTLLMLLNLAGVVRRRDRLPAKYYAAFLVHLLPLLFTWIVHTFIFIPILPFFGEILSTLSMFAIILYDQIDRYMRQQREIAHQRASIMVLEMRPHFIYNAMMSIYYLCAKDPQKAQQVTMDFTTYLRKNFTAIASEDTVPFSDELEHTRAYLAVEQVQFEDGLSVEYDTPHTNFRVPPLTLQPIVENAVKHGMDPEHAPLRITIRTREANAGNEIIVEDNGQGWPGAGAGAGRAAFAPANGPGFAPDGNKSGEPHIALANIRQRLSMMCDGKLTIRPREGGGTVATVTIPKILEED